MKLDSSMLMSSSALELDAHRGVCDTARLLITFSFLVDPSHFAAISRLGVPPNDWLIPSLSTSFSMNRLCLIKSLVIRLGDLR